MAHAVVVLVYMLVAAPLASFVPLYQAASLCAANGRTRIPVVNGLGA